MTELQFEVAKKGVSRVEQAQPMVQENQPEGVLPLLQLIANLVDKRCDRYLSTKYGLTMPQYQLLLAAHDNSQVTLGGLSDQLNCSRGNVTGIADRLERDEWIRRERSKEDRRVINVQLTDKGNRIPEIQSDVAHEMERWSKIWTDEQKGTMLNMLMRIFKELHD